MGSFTANTLTTLPVPSDSGCSTHSMSWHRNLYPRREIHVAFHSPSTRTYARIAHRHAFHGHLASLRRACCGHHRDDPTLPRHACYEHPHVFRLSLHGDHPSIYCDGVPYVIFQFTICVLVYVQWVHAFREESHGWVWLCRSSVLQLGW